MIFAIENPSRSRSSRHYCISVQNNSSACAPYICICNKCDLCTWGLKLKSYVDHTLFSITKLLNILLIFKYILAYDLQLLNSSLHFIVISLCWRMQYVIIHGQKISSNICGPCQKYFSGLCYQYSSRFRATFCAKDQFEDGIETCELLVCTERTVRVTRDPSGCRRDACCPPITSHYSVLCHCQKPSLHEEWEVAGTALDNTAQPNTQHFLLSLDMRRIIINPRVLLTNSMGRSLSWQACSSAASQ